jgi:hypothetical protein
VGEDSGETGNKPEGNKEEMENKRQGGDKPTQHDRFVDAVFSLQVRRCCHL